MESWAEYDIKLYGDEEVIEKFGNTEHALAVLNHRGDLDWMIGWVIIDRIGMLGVSDSYLLPEACIYSHSPPPPSPLRELKP